MSRIASDIIYRLTADDKEFKKSLSDAEKRVDQLGRSFVSAGRTLTRNLTAPILAAGTAAVGLAINAGNVADRLLDLEQITGLSTDTLQEFKNVAVVAGVDFESLVGVLQRFTSRLRQVEIEGSPANEAVKRLGIEIRDANGRIREADELFPEFLGRLNEIEDITERNATAQELFGRSLQDLAPVLALSADEIANARDQARDLGLVINREALVSANNFRIQVDQLKASIAAQALELGINLIPTVEKLIPIVADTVNNLANLVKQFTDLPEPVRNTILVSAGLLAALGPVLTTVGNLIIALPKLKLAFAALTGPVGLATAGIVAAGSALAVLIAREQSLAKQRIEERFGEQARAIGITTQEASGLVGVIEQLNFQFDLFGNLSTDELRRSIGQIAQDAGITARQFVELALQTGNISDGLRNQLQIIQRQLGPTTTARNLQADIAGFIQQGAENTERINQDRITQELQRQADEAERRARIEQQYADARTQVLSILQSQQTEYDRIQAQIETLQRTPWATGQLENDRLAAIEVLRQRQADIFAEEEAKEEERHQADLRRIRDLEKEDTRKRIAIAELAKEKEEEEKRGLEEIRALNLQIAAERIQQGQQIFNALSAFNNALLSREIDNIEISKRATQDKIKAIKDSSDDLTDAQLEQIRELEESEKSKAEEIAKLKRRQAEFDKANTIAQIIINTALGIVKALPDPFRIALASSLGAIQLATAVAQPIPRFATGGSFTVPAGFQNDSFPLAFAQSGERVTVETPAQASANDRKRGNTFVIEQVIASPGGLRELNRLLRQYGDVEELRRGDNDR
jgi:hypothetical protein